MLRNMNDLKNYAIRATDGDIGHVKDFYFDDATWTIRYLVVSTGTWLSDRTVLISPMALGHPDWAGKVLPVSITKEQVKNGPDIDTQMPVSRQQEMGYLDYYGYAPYWEDVGSWSGVGHLRVARSGIDFEDGDSKLGRLSGAQTRATDEADKESDLHLRGCKALIGYRIQAVDGDAGSVQDLLVDEETWAIRYLLVDASNWWVGNRILITPEQILKVSWLESAISVNLTRRAVKDATPYDPTVPMNERREVVVDEQHDHRSTFV